MGAASLARELFTDFIFSSPCCSTAGLSRGLNSSSPRAVEKNSFSAFLFQGIGGQGFNVIVNCIDCVSTSERAGSIFKLASLKFVRILFPVFY